MSKPHQNYRTIRNNQFVDEYGRIMQLRGVNLGGSSKIPATPDGATWRPDSLAPSSEVSFIGRPFPLEEASQHFNRLQSWGLTCLRFLVTWEAIEGKGPGIYDEAYLDYLTELVKKAGEHGLSLFIDPHQDVWSRFSGGDGAPRWTFDLLGLDVTKFHRAGVAYLNQESGPGYHRMSWPSNYGKYACATLFSLFFGGNRFAPQTTIQGEPVQEFLQGHYIHAVQQVASRLRGLSHVIGYDTLNEPNQGYIGWPDLNSIGAYSASAGAMPTLYQGMLLAAGHSQLVRYRANQLLPPLSRTRLNPDNLSVWKPGCQPIWQQHGIWDLDRSGRPHLLRPDYFGVVDGRPVNFDQDFFAPFVERYTAGIREVDPEAVIFISPPPADIRNGKEGFSISNPSNLVFSPHWYDGLTLIFQRYLPWLGIDTSPGSFRVAFGRKNRRKIFREVIQKLSRRAREDFPGAVAWIGETGIPFNMNRKRAYLDGDYTQQTLALDDILQALEGNFVHFSLWNYTADNDHVHGDQWNEEDLSIFCADPQAGEAGLNDGGRALEAVIRPYAMRIPGTPLHQSFDPQQKSFSFSFKPDPAIQAPLVIFVPAYHYPRGVVLEGANGKVDYIPENQRLKYWPSPSEDNPVHSLVLVQSQKKPEI